MLNYAVMCYVIFMYGHIRVWFYVYCNLQVRWGIYGLLLYCITVQIQIRKLLIQNEYMLNSAYCTGILYFVYSLLVRMLCTRMSCAHSFRRPRSLPLISYKVSTLSLAICFLIFQKATSFAIEWILVNLFLYLSSYIFPQI